MIRPLEEQFEPDKCTEISDLIAKFSALPFEGGACCYFTLEVTGCLEAGLLLAAVSVASVLLETFLCELLIFHRLQSAEPTTSRWEDTSQLVNNLEEEAEAEVAKKFYKAVRIPIHHGITRRFIATAKAEEIDMGDAWTAWFAT